MSKRLRAQLFPMLVVIGSLPSRRGSQSLLAVAGAYVLWFGVTITMAAPKTVQDIVAAYPDFLRAVDGNRLVWNDNQSMEIDDGREAKDFATLLSTPDIKDMLRIPYPTGRPAAPPVFNEDPGRIRNEAFFQKMYGDCRKDEVRKRLRKVAWFPRGSVVEMTTVNHVADRLEEVAAELARLSQDYGRYLSPIGGAYTCRMIAGSSQTSMHVWMYMDPARLQGL